MCNSCVSNLSYTLGSERKVSESLTSFVENGLITKFLVVKRFMWGKYQSCLGKLRGNLFLDACKCLANNQHRNYFIRTK